MIMSLKLPAFDLFVFDADCLNLNQHSRDYNGLLLEKLCYVYHNTFASSLYLYIEFDAVLVLVNILH